ncbi:unnamed protein product [Effrenium voratum]|nr:unnamed protein product [Effrenium voratum]
MLPWKLWRRWSRSRPAALTAQAAIHAAAGRKDGFAEAEGQGPCCKHKRKHPGIGRCLPWKLWRRWSRSRPAALTALGGKSMRLQAAKMALLKQKAKAPAASTSESTQELDAALEALEALEQEPPGSTDSTGGKSMRLQAAKMALLKQKAKAPAASTSESTQELDAALEALEALEQEPPSSADSAGGKSMRLQAAKMALLKQKAKAPAASTSESTQDLDAALEALEALEQEPPRSAGSTGGKSMRLQAAKMALLKQKAKAPAASTSESTQQLDAALEALEALEQEPPGSADSAGGKSLRLQAAKMALLKQKAKAPAASTSESTQELDAALESLEALEQEPPGSADSTGGKSMRLQAAKMALLKQKAKAHPAGTSERTQDLEADSEQDSAEARQAMRRAQAVESDSDAISDDGFPADVVIQSLRWFEWQKRLNFARRVALYMAKMHDASTEDSGAIVLALAWFQLSRPGRVSGNPGFGELRGAALARDALGTAASALRWFQRHRDLQRARMRALQAAKRTNAVDNATSAVSHLLQAAYWVVRWFEIYRQVHMARKAALYVARTQHAASRKPGGIVSQYLHCATWALRWFELNRQRYDVSRFIGFAVAQVRRADAAVAKPIAARWFYWQRGHVQRKHTAEALAQKYAMALNSSGQAIAAIWFQWRAQRRGQQQMADSMAKKFALMFQGSAEASAAAWFEYFRQVLVARQEARDADADAERRALMAEFLGKGRGEEGRWFIARRWFRQWHSLRCVKSCQQRLANMPSAAGPWCTMGSVLQQWQLHVVSGACRRRARRSRWGGLFITSSPGDSSLQQHVQVWFREAANTGRLRTKLDRMLFNRRSDAELTEWTLRIWQAWSYETAKTRAFRVMEEAILLRDDGLELCARAAKAQQEAQPPWTLLALWWFWAGRCRTARGAMSALQASASRSAEHANLQLSRCTEMQSAAAERVLIPLCLCASWFAWVSMTREAVAAALDQGLQEAKKRPEMMAARCAAYLEDFDTSLYLHNSMAAWIRYVAVAQMERNKSELEQTRANYKLALEEHNAALDSSGLKYEEALEKRVVELKEAEHRYGAATQRRLDASEAIEAKLGLAEAQTALEAEEKCQQEARKYEASLEAMALRQRLSEDRLRAEAQEAEQSEAFVFQRHQSALQAMEQKHQLALKGAEQKIQRALEKHRLELEARYVDEAEKRHQAALAQMQMVIERSRRRKWRAWKGAKRSWHNASSWQKHDGALKWRICGPRLLKSTKSCPSSVEVSWTPLGARQSKRRSTSSSRR